MVPPWVDDIESPEPVLDTPETDPVGDVESPDSETESPDSSQPNEAQPTTSPTPGPILTAPSGRFRSTRIALGKFAGSGDSRSMRQGVGRYVKSGLGGSGVATRRFAGTARTAGNLYRTLGGGGGATEGGNPLDATLLAGKSGRDIINAVVELACPVNGTQDVEASRNSINDALSELLERFPDTDLLSLSEDQREFVIERFVGMDVYRRFVLDVGTAIQAKAASAIVALSRLKEARDYIRETVSASFRNLRGLGQRLSGSRVAQLVQRALKDALDVFSGYAE